MPITMGMICQPPPGEVRPAKLGRQLPRNFVEIATRRLRLCNLKQGRRCTMPQARWSGFNLRLNDRDL